ncbi:MAG: ABC transporter ATP-binding protein [Pseudomonadota bacterium]
MDRPHRPEPLLQIEDLRVRFEAPRGSGVALAGLSLDVRAGEILALVGESGAGKSSLALALMGLLPSSAEVRGRALLGGADLLALPRGTPRSGLAVVFQEPAAALHPLWRVGSLVAEPLRRREGRSRADARAEALRLLALAGLPVPEALVDAFPHQLSGGQQQRVLLAMALACRPRLLLADEPTTALDAVTRAEVLASLDRLRRDLGLAILLITHDPSVVAACASRAGVLYAGRLVELGPVPALLEHPRHPYTRALLACTPGGGGPPRPIPGPSPDPWALPAGCVFHPRCPSASPRCRRDIPFLRPRPDLRGHLLACHEGDAAWT